MSDKIVHDAEYYILEAQHHEKWAAEDEGLEAKLTELKAKHGTPPNIIHIMWDDTPVGEIGIPHIQKMRGFETPNMNRLGAEGIFFNRMYTEPSCTPSRAAVITGRHAVRSGMYNVSFPIENDGLAADEVTAAEMLSEVGYATAFYGKWHLGDIEESYCHNQGFDEALFAPYNQVPSLWTPQGEAANAILGLHTEMLPDDPYDIDESWRPRGFVYALEGKKGGLAREWGKGGNLDNYNELEVECQKRTLDFVRRNAAAKKPFFCCYWPQLSAFIPNPEKVSVARTLLYEGLTRLDVFIGELMAELKDLGIAENTLVILMADNGPMTHNGPLGMNEALFRGGKGDYWEGGVRVPALAWWPDVIEPGQIVGDIIHETDLFTTFARLAGATAHIPTDRVIDGIDQTSLFLNGDTYSRRDYNFIYTGTILAATVKGRFKRIWVGEHPGLTGAAFYDIYNDPRETHGMMLPLFHTKSMFNRMRARHEVWKKRYPDRPTPRGTAFTGIEDPRPEIKAVSQPPVDIERLPFDVEEYLDHPLPYDESQVYAD